MSNRLTYSAISAPPAWTRLVLPGMLLLSAIALLGVPDLTGFSFNDQIEIPAQMTLCLILVTLSALLIQETLPAKAPAGAKALATAIAAPLSLLFLVPNLQTLSVPGLTGWSLLVAGWLFFLNARDRSKVWMLASGLCAGLAVSLDPMCLSGLLPLTLWNLADVFSKKQQSSLPFLLLLLSLTLGFLPLFLGTSPSPAPFFNSFAVEPLRDTVRLFFETLPVAAYPFLLIGVLICFLQKQPVMLRLILSTLLLHLLLTGFRPAPATLVYPGFWLVTSWITAYGILRLMRGIEQGIRNVSNPKAKRFPALATFLCILSFGFWVLSRYTPS
jgi:hypothetical protein